MQKCSNSAYLNMKSNIKSTVSPDVSMVFVRIPEFTLPPSDVWSPRVSVRSASRAAASKRRISKRRLKRNETRRPMLVHPWRLTWNIIMEVCKIIFLSKLVIWRFHVNLPGCKWCWLPVVHCRCRNKSIIFSCIIVHDLYIYRYTCVPGSPAPLSQKNSKKTAARASQHLSSIIANFHHIFTLMLYNSLHKWISNYMIYLYLLILNVTCFATFLACRAPASAFF